MLCRRDLEAAGALVLTLLTTFLAVSCRALSLRDSPITVARVRALGEKAPIHGVAVTFRGVVTYTDPVNHLLFVQDATAGIKVEVGGLSPLPRRSEFLEVQGLVLRSSRLPFVAHPSFTILGSAQQPSAVLVRPSQLVSLDYASRKVRMTGIAQSAEMDQNGALRVRVHVGQQVFGVRIKDNTDSNRVALPGAFVDVEGVTDPVFDEAGSMEDYRIWADSSEDLRIIRPALPLSSFDAVTVGSLRQRAREIDSSSLPLRVRLCGDVVEDGRGGFQFIDATGTLPLTVALDRLAFTGHRLNVWAFPRSLAGGLVLEDAVLAAGAGPRSPVFRPVALLRHISDVRALAAGEAAKGLAVDVQGTVTYASSVWGILFVQDPSSGIFVNTLGPLPPGIRAGWRVRVRGKSSAGGFAPSISYAQVAHLGESVLPRPTVMTHQDLQSGRMDSQRVTVEAVARSFEPSNGPLTLRLMDGQTRLTAYLDGWRTLPQYLLGARVRLTGACGSSANSRRQFNGIEVYVPRPDCVRVIEPRPDPFISPVRSIRDLLQFSPSERPGREVRLRGVVTMAGSSGSVFMRDATGGIQVLSTASTQLELGEIIDAAGYPAATRLGTVLEDARIRGIRPGPPPEPQHTTVYQILDRNLDSQLVELDARLVSQIPTPIGLHLLLESAGRYFTANSEANLSLRETLDPGAVLRLRGICSVTAPVAAGENIPDSFELRLRTADDIRILRPAAWWTAERAQRIIVVGGLLFLGALLWVLMLRRRVSQQTATINRKLDIEALRTRQLAKAAQDLAAEKAELLRTREDLQRLATRDGLTGVWNRSAIFDLLESTLSRCRRAGQPTSAIMCDLDGFKRINDCRGHPAGDRVLREISTRFQSCIRASDFVGRYGGEEFLIVLSDCDGRGALERAEQLRCEIESRPIVLDGGSLNITCSFGVSCAHDSKDCDQLVREADNALYRAKRLGKNRVECSEIPNSSTPRGSAR